MPLEFINPNWHVVMIHAPMGLLIVGVFIELFSFLWRESSVRTAARWMILIGTLALIPVTTLGIYAFRDVVTGGPIHRQSPWTQVIQDSPWNANQWLFMKRHILFMAIATGLFLIGVLTWIGASTEGRRKLHWPVMVILLAGIGVMGSGAWFAGEAVYREGTAVERMVPPPATGPNAEMIPSHEATKSSAATDRVTYYLSPMQMHLLMAGLVIAAAFGALAASLQRWSNQTSAPSAWQQTPPPEWQEPVIVRPPGGPEGSVVTPVPQANPVPAVYPARFWLIAFLLAAATVVGGLWIAKDWKLEEGLFGPLRDPEWRRTGQRNFAHVLCGLALVLLPLLISLIARFARRAKGITLFFVLLLVVAAGIQIWLGILLLFDSSYGLITRFNS